MRQYLLLTALTVLTAGALRAQLPGEEVVIDRIAAQVGEEVIFYSELELNAQEISRLQKIPIDEARCRVLRDNLRGKLLLNQANIDSVEVSPDEVAGELERRMRFFIAQFGGDESKLEEFYGKTVPELKAELAEPIRDQLRVKRMRSRLFTDVKVSPTDVRRYYENIPEDSLPRYNMEMEVAQIVLYPEPTKVEEQVAYDKAMELYNRIIADTAAFSKLAVLYSCDPGSGVRGGDLGPTNKDNFVPEYSAAAMALQKGDISKPVRSPFGYHIIQLKERLGNVIDTRHILICPRITGAAISKAERKLDSIREKIMYDTLTFAEAAELYSDDERTKNNGGLMVSPASGESRIPVDEMDRQVFFTVEGLNVGEISEPVSFTEQGRQRKGIRILMLRDKIKPHVANLKDDYDRIRALALEEQKGNRFEEWVNQTIPKTYIKVNQVGYTCPDLGRWTDNGFVDE